MLPDYNHVYSNSIVLFAKNKNWSRNIEVKKHEPDPWLAKNGISPT